MIYGPRYKQCMPVHVCLNEKVISNQVSKGDRLNIRLGADSSTAIYMSVSHPGAIEKRQLTDACGFANINGKVRLRPVISVSLQISDERSNLLVQSSPA